MNLGKCLLSSALAVLAILSCDALALGERQTSDNPIVEMKTSMGTVKIELFQDKAPITVKNFLSYVDEKFYDGTVFHRVMGNFMIQGGGFDGTDPLREKRAKAPIKNEASNGLKNDRGTIAMARTSDPDSATAQFFINVVNNDRLNRPQPDGHGYAVFGKVIEGMDVVDKIRQTKTGKTRVIARDANGKETGENFDNVPLQKVTIESVRRVTPKKG